MSSFLKAISIAMSLLLGFSLTSFADEVEVIKSGKVYSYSLDKSGKKRLDVECLKVEFSDSTRNSYVVNYTLRVTAIGKNIPLKKHGMYYTPGLNYYPKNSDVLSGDGVLPAGKSVEYTISRTYYATSLKEIDGLSYEGVYICMFHSTYDPTALIERYERENKAAAEEKQRQLEKKAAEEERLRQQGGYMQSFTPISMNLNAINLLPSNMRQYIGKVTQEEFEKVVGEPVGQEEEFVVYNVKNEYDDVETGIRCFYRESDGILLSVKFPTPHYLGFWIDFTKLDGYPKTDAQAIQNGNLKYKENVFGEKVQIDFKLKDFGCQIMEISERNGFSNAVVNYHIVK